MISVKKKKASRFNQYDAQRVIHLLNHKYGLNGHDPAHCDICKSQMMKSIPGQDHPVPAIGRMEIEIYKLIDWDRFLRNVLDRLGLTRYLKKAIDDKNIYKPDGKPFTIEEMNVIDDFIRQELKIAATSIEAAIVRSYIIGNILNSVQAGTKQSVKLKLSELPSSIAKLAEKYPLTQHDINAINYAITRTGEAIKGISEDARSTIAKTLIEARMEGRSPENLALDLIHNVTDSQENLNRDWRRVAITEANAATSNGFLAGCEAGEKVVGVSLPTACELCKKLIENKVFTVRKEPPPDYKNLDPGSPEYKEIAKIWETQVWVGKTNEGRSGSLRKRGPEGKLVDREHHEISLGIIPLHPYCRCYWRKLVE